MNAQTGQGRSSQCALPKFTPIGFSTQIRCAHSLIVGSAMI
jgi:hypothetical protein